MSARREKRLRALERRVEALETIAATPVFIHTQGDGKEDYVLEAVWSKETADTYRRAGDPLPLRGPGGACALRFGI